MIRVAVVEDERGYVEKLKEYLARYQEEYGEQFQIAEYFDGDEIVENYRGQFDIILLDIEMKFMDGMTTARRIRETDGEVIIIFITNMAQYAIQGYAVDALDYVLKPVSYFAFRERLKRAVARVKRREVKYIKIHARNRVIKVAIPDIYWIESQGHRLTYYTREGNYESTVHSMKEIEEALRDDCFFRCNKCYLVNLAQVKGMEDGYAIVGDDKVQISRARKGEFQKALTNYVGMTR